MPSVELADRLIVDELPSLRGQIPYTVEYVPEPGTIVMLLAGLAGKIDERLNGMK